MEINRIGLGLAGALVDSAQNSTPAVTGKSAQRSAPTVQQTSPRQVIEQRGNALGILRQEIRQALSTFFRIRVAATIPGYQLPDAAPSSAEVTEEAASGARQIARRSPLDAREELVRLRFRIDESAANTRRIAGDDDDVDDVVSRVSREIDELDDDAARNTVSTASVLSAESKLRQRSSIRIRTQEGDVVQFELRRIERFSAQDVAASDGNSSISSTRVEMSTRNRMMLRVNGDLNEAEFAAIQNVFNQAEAIAEEFFAGDLAAAFNLAGGIDFDTGQLANVKMRFRERQVTNVSYAAISQQTPVAAKPTLPADIGLNTKPDRPATTVPIAEPPTDAARGDLPKPISLPATLGEKPSEISPKQAFDPTPAPVAYDALDGFFDLLSKFLNGMNEGFELGSDVTSFRFFYSQSFKLEILKSVLQVNAPEDSGEAAASAATIIDGIADDSETD